MASPRDSTQVVRMVDEFDNFIYSPRRSYSVDNNSQNVFPKLDFSNNSSNLSVNLIRDRFKSDSIIESSQGKQKLVKEILDSNKKRRICERELLLAKTSVSKLEAQMSATDASNKRIKLDYEKELYNIKLSKEKEHNTVENMKTQIDSFSKQEENYKKKIRDWNSQLTDAKLAYEDSLRISEKEKSALHRQISELETKLLEANSSNNENVIDLKNKLKNAEDLNEFYRLQTAEKDKSYEELKNELICASETKIEFEKSQQKIRELKDTVMKQEEAVKLALILKSKADKYPKIEKENKDLHKENHYLREMNSKCLLIKEQHESLKQKVKRLEDKLLNYHVVIQQNEMLEQKLNDWIQACSVIMNDPSPSQLSSMINQLHQSEALLSNEVASLKTKCMLTESKLKESQTTTTQLENKIQKNLKNEGDRAAYLRRMQRKMHLLVTERDSYRNLLNSYESEMTINPSAQSMERVQKLEEILSEYRSMCAKLEEDLKASKPANETSTPCDLQITSEKHLKALEEKELSIQSLKEKNSTLNQKLHDIIVKIGYDPSQTKVISFTMNPTAIELKKNTDLISDLKEKNDKLTKRIKILEEKKGEDVADLTLQVESKIEQQGSIKTREELQDKLTSAELKNKRMMDAFKKTTNEFREVTYMLLGYRIDIPRNNFYKLSSMYAESPDDYLLFEMTGDGTLQLMETEFSKTISDLIENYLQKQGSIPAFLNMVTSDLFGKQTIVL